MTSLRTPTPPGYGNSTCSLTPKAIEIALNKRPNEEYKHNAKGNRGASSGETDKHLTNHLKTFHYLKTS